MTARTSHRRRHSRLAALALLASGLVAPTVLTTPAQAAPTPVVRYSDRDVVVGKKVNAVVKRASRPKNARLVLQRRFPDRWRSADGSAQRRKRGFVLRVPTDQLGTFTYRVVAKKGGSVVARSKRAKVTVRPRYDPVGRPRQHVFMNSPVVRWDSCQRIRWTFNDQRSPKRALRQLREGFRRVHQATGLKFRYVGRTDHRPDPYGTGLKGADVIVGWRSPQEYEAFGRHTVGLGGFTYSGAYREADGTRVHRAVRGGIVLNAGMKGRVRNGFGKGHTWGEVIIHEIGHVLGLGHTPARRQIMYFQVIPRNAAWGAGDLAGLHRVGNARGCLRPIRGRTVGEPVSGRWASP